MRPMIVSMAPCVMSPILIATLKSSDAVPVIGIEFVIAEPDIDIAAVSIQH